MSWRPQGLRAWLWQRLTAAYLALFIVAAVVVLAIGGPWDYERWHQLVAHPFVNVATGLFFGALLVHAWVGLRDILIDYCPPVGLRFAILMLMTLGMFATGIWVFLILAAVVQI